jgi:ribosomal protein L7Ae-like RNA K-turn-binding protein
VVVVSEDMDVNERKLLFLVRAESKIVKLGVVRPPKLLGNRVAVGSERGSF